MCLNQFKMHDGDDMDNIWSSSSRRSMGRKCLVSFELLERVTKSVPMIHAHMVFFELSQAGGDMCPICWRKVSTLLNYWLLKSKVLCDSLKATQLCLVVNEIFFFRFILFFFGLVKFFKVLQCIWCKHNTVKILVFIQRKDVPGVLC